MSIGDALKDMPDEYREYVENGEAAQARSWRGEFGWPLDVEQSEVDKAIADGKPRWMCHPELGWQYVVFIRRKDHRWPHPLLVYRMALDSASSLSERPLMLVEITVEILPYGESPYRLTPAPEKPKAVAAYEPELFYGDPFRVTGFQLCPDCDVPTEDRSMLARIEQWCPVCNVRVSDSRNDDTDGEAWRNAVLGRFKEAKA